MKKFILFGILFFSFNLRADVIDEAPFELVVQMVSTLFAGTNLKESLRTLVDIKSVNRKCSLAVDFVAKDIIHRFSIRGRFLTDHDLATYKKLQPNLSPSELIKVILARAVLNDVDLNRALESYCRFEESLGHTVDFLGEFVLDPVLIEDDIVEGSTLLAIVLKKSLKRNLMPEVKCKNLVHLLLAAGVDPNQPMNSVNKKMLPIEFVRGCFSSEVLEVFLRYNPEINFRVAPFIQGRPHFQRTLSFASGPSGETLDLSERTRCELRRNFEIEQSQRIDMLLREYILRKEAEGRLLMQREDHR